MSLDNIQLPPSVLADLFKDSLVDLKENQAPPANAEQDQAGFLGKNQRRIAILVDSPGLAYMAENELNLLTEILSACRCTLNDVAIVNCADKKYDYQQLSEWLGYEKMILFGLETTFIELPMQIPNYQLQAYNDRLYLASSPLQVLESNREEKKKLWLQLKRMFDL